MKFSLKKNIRKSSVIVLMTLLIIAITNTKVSASYIYTPIGEVASPEALTITKIIDSSNILDVNGVHIDLNIGKLTDVDTTNDKVFLVDSTNNKVIVLNDKYEYVTSFPNGEITLNEPRGIYVTNDYIYVCDTLNYRVLIFDMDYNYVRTVGTPDDPTFRKPDEVDENKYPFKPCKIAVDRTGRMYVFADQVFEGFVDLNPDGSFSRYVGANKVKVSAIEQFWLLFTSEEQKKSQGLRISESLVNVNCDKDGYIYSVSKQSEGDQAIKKLNSRGNDVLNRNGYTPPTGDQITSFIGSKVSQGGSDFIDIDINDDEGYIVLDSTRGRIFCYDFEGNLLYIGAQSGSIGEKSSNRSDLFKSPTALSYFNDSILVTDSMNQNLVVFEYTEFSKMVNLATHYYKEGLYDEASSEWAKIIELNSNYCLAYAGVGKAQFRNGDYKNAMKNLKLGYDYYNYSKAYQQYRYDKLTTYFPYAIAIVLVGIVFGLGRSIRKSIKGEKEEEKYD